MLQVWLKSIHLCIYRVGKANFDTFHGLVTLKNRSKSPKSNQLFPPSQLCIYASLVKFHPMVQKIYCRKEATRTPTQTPTLMPTPTGSVPKTTCPPPSVGGTSIEKTFKNLLLQNQKAYDFETWYEASGNDHGMTLTYFTARSTLGRPCI